jgi:hypothetical protein
VLLGLGGFGGRWWTWRKLLCRGRLYRGFGNGLLCNHWRWLLRWGFCSDRFGSGDLRELLHWCGRSFCNVDFGCNRLSCGGLYQSWSCLCCRLELGGGNGGRGKLLCRCCGFGSSGRLWLGNSGGSCSWRLFGFFPGGLLQDLARLLRCAQVLLEVLQHERQHLLGELSGGFVLDSVAPPVQELYDSLLPDVDQLGNLEELAR